MKGKRIQKEWTEGRRRSFIVSVLRSGSRRWPPKYQCLNNAFVGKQINKASGREAKHYECASCKGHFPAKDIDVDHIKPIIGKEGFISWDKFIENLYCSIDNLQTLCKVCHKAKTKGERQ